MNKFRPLLLGSAAALFAVLPAAAQTAPPTRVAQLTAITGNVSFNGAGSNGAWIAASDNFPVTMGDSVFTQDNAGAAIVIDSSRLAIAQNTEVQVATLDESSFTVNDVQGEVLLHVPALAAGQVFEIGTPGGTVRVAQSATVDVVAGDSAHPTTIAVLAGEATLGGAPISVGNQVSVDAFGRPSYGPVQEDGFVAGQMASLVRPPPPPYVPQAVADMSGGNELAAYGDWSQDPTYGAVWYPNVGAGWAPYREGHWAFVPPWGWTWVEAEPWGFAPFHYGRWIDAPDGRWGWVPAADFQAGYERPVYAPALVTFVGIAAGVAITAEILSHGNVGWVPLAPNEAFRPYYRAPEAYVQRINRFDVRNGADIRQDRRMDDYANRRGATFEPSADMARGGDVARDGRPMTPAMFGQARPAGAAPFAQGVRPDFGAAGGERRVAPPQTAGFVRSEQAGQQDRPQSGAFAPAPESFRPVAPNEQRQQETPQRAPGVFPPGAQFAPAQRQEERPQPGFAPQEQQRPQEMAPPARPAFMPQQERPQAAAPRPEPQRQEAPRPAGNPQQRQENRPGA
jgi:hypothetical protein